MITEREHWLSITDDPGWKRNHISDPNISLTATVDAIVSAFPQDPKRILEIGCGYGRLTRPIGERFPGAELFGMDINDAVLDEAERCDPGTVFFLADAIYDFDNAGYDAIYSVAVFQHLPDDQKRAYVLQAYDALTEGGVLRLQFIDGVRDQFCDHWTPLEDIRSWMLEAGFTLGFADIGLVHRQWTWLTGTK